MESARAQMMQNPPHLSQETLQQLLSAAHFPLAPRLLALQDDDSKSAQGNNLDRSRITRTGNFYLEFISGI